MNQNKILEPDYDYAVFPLHTVLFPGCKIALRIFEQRYLSMVSECTSRDRPFVVSLISGSGSEVGETSECNDVASIARIIDFNQGENGTLDIIALAGSRVLLREKYYQPDKLLRAKLEPYTETECTELAQHYHFLKNILAAFMREQPGMVQGKLDSLTASEISFYLSYFAPVSMPKRQKLLELNDTDTRLAELQAIFADRSTTFTA